MPTAIAAPLKVADEVFLVVAALHRTRPEREDFTVGEIMEQARELNLSGGLRPGVEIHVRQHSVANLPPNPGRYRTLYAVGKRRRLLAPGDPTHQERDGKIWPELDEIPAEFHDLVHWARQRFGMSIVRAAGLSELIGLRGTGRELWRDEPADAYVQRLRENWQ